MTDSAPPPASSRLLAATWLLGAARAQRWMWSETWCAWTRRPLPSARHARQLGEGRRFALRRGSWMSVLVPMVVVSLFVDVLIAQGVIHVAAAPAHRALWHGVLAFVSLWMVVWAVSLRSATRQVEHVLGPQSLTLAIGLSQLCRIPLAAVADVRRIKHKVGANGKDWLDACGLQRGDVTVLSPLDPPTLLIALHADATGAWRMRNGAPRPLRRWVAVYVDRPDEMRGAIAGALPPVPGIERGQAGGPRAGAPARRMDRPPGVPR